MTVSKPVAELPICHFLGLSAEIRLLIYNELLVTEGLIEDAHMLIGTKETIMENERPPVGSLYCTILQTCRTIYDEALPVLYRHNAFYFKRPSDSTHFAQGYVHSQRSLPRSWTAHSVPQTAL